MKIRKITAFIPILCFQLFSCKNSVQCELTDLESDYLIIGKVFQNANVNYDSLKWHHSPHIFQNSEGVISLKIEAHGLHSIPNEINQLLKLKQLNVWRNKIKHMDNLRIPTLTSLFIDHNRLSRLPDLTKCKALKNLSISNNLISGTLVISDELPESIYRLSLGKNDISKLLIAKEYENLEFLELQKNKIRRLNSSFKKLPNLEILNLTDNPIDTLDFSKLPDNRRIEINIGKDTNIVVINRDNSDAYLDSDYEDWNKKYYPWTIWD